jgi:hypothetical protein
MPHDYPTRNEDTPAPVVSENRRGSQRSRSARPIPRRVYRVEDLRPLDAWIVDLSCGGLALLLPERLPAGATLFLEVESVPEAPPLKVWASVVRCAPDEGGEWLVGCELVNRLSEGELETLLI